MAIVAFAAVLDARQDLHAALVLPEGADEALEAAAWQELGRHYGVRAEKKILVA